MARRGARGLEKDITLHEETKKRMVQQELYVPQKRGAPKASSSGGRSNPSQPKPIPKAQAKKLLKMQKKSEIVLLELTCQLAAAKSPDLNGVIGSKLMKRAEDSEAKISKSIETATEISAMDTMEKEELNKFIEDFQQQTEGGEKLAAKIKESIEEDRADNGPAKEEKSNVTRRRRTSKTA